MFNRPINIAAKQGDGPMDWEMIDISRIIVSCWFHCNPCGERRAEEYFVN